ALGVEGGQFREERAWTQRHPVPHQTDLALENPRGDLVQHELPGAAVDGVARIGPALVAHDEVGALGEHVHELALPLVAPLGADYDHTVGFWSEHGLLGRAASKKRPRWCGALDYPLRKDRRRSPLNQGRGEGLRPRPAPLLG